MVELIGSERILTELTPRRRGGRVAEGNGLLNRHRGKTLSRVQIPPSPPNFIGPALGQNHLDTNQSVGSIQKQPIDASQPFWKAGFGTCQLAL